MKHQLQLSGFLLSWAWLITAMSSNLRAQFESISKLILNDANSILVIHADQIRASNWFRNRDGAAKLDQLRSEMPLFIPAGAKTVVLAARLEAGRMKAHWEMAIVASAAQFDLSAIAGSVGGTVEEIGGVSCCISGDQALVQFQPSLLGVLAPADRQTAARWVRDVQSGRTGQLTPFLTDVISRARVDRATDVQWAVDLEDTFSPIAIRRAMSRSEVLQKKKHDKQAVADLLTGLKGVQFSIDVSDTLSGRLDWRFGSAVEPIKDFGGEIAIEAMASAGLMLDELSNWSVKTNANELELAGVVEEASVRKLFSLLGVHDSQGPVKVTLENGSASVSQALRGSDQDESRRITGRYVGEISKMVDDVNSIRGADLNRQLMWVQNYGRRIDSMSTRNVDPEIGQLGKAIANQLLDIVAIYNSGNQRAVERQRTMVPDVQVQVNNEYYDRITTPYGRYYRYDPTYSMNFDLKSTVDEYRAIADEELNQANESAGNLIAQIKDEIAQIQAIYRSRYGGK